jgi:hypothetical protein
MKGLLMWTTWFGKSAGPLESSQPVFEPIVILTFR